MKRVILTLVLVSGLCFVSEAQDNKQVNNKVKQEHMKLSPQERAVKNAERAEKELGLTAEQKTKWQTASLTKINANEAVKQKMQGSTTPEERKELHKQMRLNKAKFELDVFAFLSPEQKVKYDAAKTKHHSHQTHKAHKPQHNCTP